MSNKFIWVRNPTVQNGLATTYVSKRGSDTTGDGTAQNPFASIAKATSVAYSGSNIMLDNGQWNEAKTSNNRIFIWWGNSYTMLLNGFYPRYDEKFHFLILLNCQGNVSIASTVYFYCYNCILDSCFSRSQRGGCWAENCIVANAQVSYYASYYINCIVGNPLGISTRDTIINSIIISGSVFATSNNSNYNNFTNLQIPQTGNVNSINNATTGQTFYDYFNYYDANDLLKCDFTAKDGSANIGAGEKGSTIGLNQGFAARADGTATDVFSSSNGATLKNVVFSSTLNGYILQQKYRVCAGATANTITFDNEASTENDYYKGLFVGITEGVGETQIRYIISYNGATRTATVNSNWTTIPDTESEYTISGKIDSVVKDFGKAIKVKRNFTFCDNMTALENGQWEEFLTAANAENEMIPASCYSYEYSVDGVTWRSSTELVSATDGTNYVDAFTIGDASEQFNEEIAEFLVFRYIRFHIHIGFNIDVFAEK